MKPFFPPGTRPPWLASNVGPPTGASSVHLHGENAGPAASAPQSLRLQTLPDPSADTAQVGLSPFTSKCESEPSARQQNWKRLPAEPSAHSPRRACGCRTPSRRRGRGRPGRSSSASRPSRRPVLPQHHAPPLWASHTPPLPRSSNTMAQPGGAVG